MTRNVFRGVRGPSAAARCKLTMHPTHNPWLVMIFDHPLKINDTAHRTGAYNDLIGGIGRVASRIGAAWYYGIRNGWQVP